MRKVKRPRRIESSLAKKAKKRSVSDPSLEFISDPSGCPTARAAQEFFREQGVEDFRIVCGATTEWRLESKLACRGSPARIGFFAPGSHSLVPQCSSPSHHPALNQAMQLVQEAVDHYEIPGFDDSNGSGVLRFVLARVQRADSRVQLTLVLNAGCDLSAVDSMIDWLKQKGSWHSIWIHEHSGNKHDNAVTCRNGPWTLKFGDEFLKESMMSDSKLQVPLYFLPGVFRQANMNGFEKIIRTIRRFVTPGSKVLELYGGVGTIGLNLLDKAQVLKCSDENPKNVSCFRKSLNHVQKKVQVLYVSKGAAAMVTLPFDYDVAIVDPPRKGLDPQVVAAFSRKCKFFASGSCTFGGKCKKSHASGRIPQRLVYVSCGFPAFKRDAQALIQEGWRIIHAEGHILFPGADHIECLSVFERK
jgi:tRNA/tmRNA/rRNA uracil-C5-methylase (TrmA/RlmC/RlmD family)